MKKGDLKKQEILDTAETLFCKNGYDTTSIQDILDCMKSSKGSFYHHFVSKAALLEGICRRRAAYSYTSTVSAVSEQNSFEKNLNLLLSGMIPFRDEKLSFLIMLLPTFNLPEGRIVRNSYCEALSDKFFPAVCNQLQTGIESKKIFCEDPAMTTSLILSIVNRFWITICDMILAAEKQKKETDISVYLRLAECYRLSLERILLIPYGAIDLIDIPTLILLLGKIHNHWVS